jgi:hypothetical protein
MPRGRPPKNKKCDQSFVGIAITNNPNSAVPNIDKPKRKYTKREPAIVHKTEDGHDVVQEAKKRGRKRGRKKKDQDTLYNPEEVIDFIERNYPQYNLGKIKNKIITGLAKMREFGNRPNLLYRISYDGKTYHYDDRGTIYNTDGATVGVFVKVSDGYNKMYLFNRKKPLRTPDNVLTDADKRLGVKSNNF